MLASLSDNREDTGVFGTLGSYTRVLHIVGKFAYRSVHGTSGLRACGCPASTVLSGSWHADVEPASYPPLLAPCIRVSDASVAK